MQLNSSSNSDKWNVCLRVCEWNFPVVSCKNYVFFFSFFPEHNKQRRNYSITSPFAVCAMHGEFKYTERNSLLKKSSLAIYCSNEIKRYSRARFQTHHLPLFWKRKKEQPTITDALTLLISHFIFGIFGPAHAIQFASKFVFVFRIPFQVLIHDNWLSAYIAPHSTTYTTPNGNLYVRKYRWTCSLFYCCCCFAFTVIITIEQKKSIRMTDRRSVTGVISTFAITDGDAENILPFDQKLINFSNSENWNSSVLFG